MPPTSPEHAAALASTWAVNHPAEMEWIGENMERSEFAMSLAGALDKWGSLTDRQLEAVRKNIGRAATKAAAPEVTTDAIEAKFAIALGNQVKKPMLRLDTFVFKFAGTEGRNAGAIFVTDTEHKDEEGRAAYLGKVLGGKFLRVGACTDEQQQRILAAAANPDEAAKAYGVRTGNCCICGRTLTAEESIERFIGPICAGKFGMR